MEQLVENFLANGRSEQTFMQMYLSYVKTRYLDYLQLETLEEFKSFLSSNFDEETVKEALESLKHFYQYLIKSGKIDKKSFSSRVFSQNLTVGPISIFAFCDSVGKLTNHLIKRIREKEFRNNELFLLRDLSIIYLLLDTDLTFYEISKLTSGNLRFRDGYLKFQGDKQQTLIVKLAKRDITALENYLEMYEKSEGRTSYLLFFGRQSDVYQETLFNRNLKEYSKNFGITTSVNASQIRKVGQFLRGYKIELE